MKKQEIIDVLIKEIEWTENDPCDDAEVERGFLMGLRQAIFLIGSMK
jgi:hypothetical protein